MTHFEFISVAVSIVLALSAARLLAALPHVLAPGRRYWIHALWSLALLFAHMDFWWTIWIYREIDPWTFTGFAVVMANSLLCEAPRLLLTLLGYSLLNLAPTADRTRRRLRAPRRRATRVASSTADARWSGDPCAWHHHNERTRPCVSRSLGRRGYLLQHRTAVTSARGADARHAVSRW